MNPQPVLSSRRKLRVIAQLGKPCTTSRLPSNVPPAPQRPYSVRKTAQGVCTPRPCASIPAGNRPRSAACRARRAALRSCVHRAHTDPQSMPFRSARNHVRGGTFWSGSIRSRFESAHRRNALINFQFVFSYARRSDPQPAFAPPKRPLRQARI